MMRRSRRAARDGTSTVTRAARSGSTHGAPSAHRTTWRYERPKVSSAFFMLPFESAMNLVFASGLLKQ